MGTCISTLDLCLLRVAQLTAAGAPSSGASKGATTSSIKQAQIGLEIETGAEFIEKNGCGEICISAKEADKIKRATVTLDLCKLDFELLQLLTDGSLASSGGNGVFLQPPSVDASDPDPVSIELWTKAWDGAAQDVHAFTSPAATYLHWVLPYVKFTWQPFTLKNGPTIFQFKGDGSENANITANGPFNDWGSVIAGQGGVQRVFGVFLEDDLPTATCGYTAVPSGS